MSGPNGALSYCSETVSIADRSVEFPRLHLTPAYSLKGRVTVTGAKPDAPFPKGLRVSLQPKDRIRITGESTAGSVDGHGAFEISRALTDEYWLEILGLPSGYYVREASIDGRDAWNEPLRIGTGELHAVLGADGPTLTGQVSDDENRPVAGAVLILAAAPMRRGLAPGQILVSAADRNGQFSYSSMSPGDYRLMAFVNLALEEAEDPDLVRASFGRAMQVSLSPGEQKNVLIRPLQHGSR